MIDVVESKGLEIDYDKLSKDLNVTVIPIKAAKGQGVDKLKETIEKNNFTHIKDSNKFDFKDEKSAYKYIEKVIHNCLKEKNANKRYFNRR